MKIRLKIDKLVYHYANIVFKREFPVVFDADKTKNVQNLDEKMQPIKKIVIEKIQKKKSLKNLNGGILTPYLGVSSY